MPYPVKTVYSKMLYLLFESMQQCSKWCTITILARIWKSRRKNYYPVGLYDAAVVVGIIAICIIRYAHLHIYSQAYIIHLHIYKWVHATLLLSTHTHTQPHKRLSVSLCSGSWRNIGHASSTINDGLKHRKCRRRYGCLNTCCCCCCNCQLQV